MAGAEPAPATGGNFAVRIGAFSVRANAERLATGVARQVASVGPLSLVTVGPFASRGQAAEALAKPRAQGYTDALITTHE